MLSKEENFIIKCILTNKKIDRGLFEQLDYSKLTRISSGHLIIPTLYSCLVYKKQIDFLEKKFKNYIYEIYKLNTLRNQKFNKWAEWFKQYFKK